MLVLWRPSPLTGPRYNCPGQPRYALNIHRQVRGRAAAPHIEPGWEWRRRATRLEKRQGKKPAGRRVFMCAYLEENVKAVLSRRLAGKIRRMRFTLRCRRFLTTAEHEQAADSLEKLVNIEEFWRSWIAKDFISEITLSRFQTVLGLPISFLFVVAKAGCTCSKGRPWKP